MKKLLTIIITFLNEKKEVELTLESIVATCNHHLIDIILVDDCSDDFYDYKSVASIYQCIYIRNDKRLGVAPSRDIAIKHSQTPYFLLLDAHMRFFQDNWHSNITDALIKNDRTLICCQSKALIKLKNKIVEYDKSISYNGAIVNFYENSDFLLTPLWNPLGNNEEPITDIVCVLGAGYACSKKYWTYLKGLEGLMHYGYDEPYISIKVWLEGGRCLLLKDVVIGHIYRNNENKTPYHIDDLYYIYNRLLIAELLLPVGLKKYIYSETKYNFFSLYNKAILLLYNNRHLVYELKKYYKNIFTKNFLFYEELNNKNNFFINKHKNTQYILKNIANKLVLNGSSIDSIGLLNGRLGIAIFLFYYSYYTKNILYSDLSKSMVKNIINHTTRDLSFSFYSGLCGLGWGLLFLKRKRFIYQKIDHILDYIDMSIQGLNPAKIFDSNINFGLGGIVIYILSRLYDLDLNKRTKVFDMGYLSDINNKISDVISKNIDSVDCVDIFIDYMLFMSDNSLIPEPNIKDIIYLSCPTKYSFDKFDYGLIGNAGIGLKLILEDCYEKKINASCINKHIAQSLE